MSLDVGVKYVVYHQTPGQPYELVSVLTLVGFRGRNHLIFDASPVQRGQVELRRRDIKLLRAARPDAPHSIATRSHRKVRA